MVTLQYSDSKYFTTSPIQTKNKLISNSKTKYNNKSISVISTKLRVVAVQDEFRHIAIFIDTIMPT